MRVIIVFLALTLTGCSFQKKISRWLDKNAADYCNEKFPVKEITDTVYQYGDSVYYDMYRQAQRYADSLSTEMPAEMSDGIDTIRVTRYITRTVTKVRVDSSKIASLKRELEAKEELLQKKESQIAERELTMADLKKQINKQTQYLFSVGGLFVASMVMGSRRMWKLLAKKVVK